MDLTQEIILQHGRNSPYKGHLKNPTRSAELENPLCGDVVKIEAIIKGEEVKEMVFSGEGCLISQSAASLLVGEVKKVKKTEKIKNFEEETVLRLLGFEPTLSRKRCALLPLEALKRALGN